ncbi:MAG: sialidase family protein [Pseudomonadota bacterium]
MTGTVRLLVGTTKGCFILTANADRAGWSLSGPFCDGWPINHAIGRAADGMLWAAGGNDWVGAGVWRSPDGGETWSLTRFSSGYSDVWIAENPEFAAQLGLQPRPPAAFGNEVDAIWSLASQGDRLYAGSKPAELFLSTDTGETWQKVTGLHDHPSKQGWEPGAAGLTLHSIVTDPEDAAKLWVGISAAGVFATEDGGKSWERRNRLANGNARGDTETALCVHHLERAPATNGVGRDLLYQQNHQGTFRSSDGGRSWQDITAGLPSDFGFPIAVDPHDPATIWVMPLNGDMVGRYPPDAAAAVWRSCDGGASWGACREGLPGRNCFFTVLRQAMATDRGRPTGVYFGTNSGSVFASRDGGDNWAEIARHLPTVLCVETIEGAPTGA